MTNVRHAGVDAIGARANAVAERRQSLFHQSEGWPDSHQPVSYSIRTVQHGCRSGRRRKPNTGHHHPLIDATLSGDELKQPIPMDDGHRHFGNGQTEAMITLPPGPHKLQLVLGDWSHIPHTPPVMSDVITVTVR